MDQSIWEIESFFGEQDLVIVGSGFTGLWSAYLLKKKHPKLRVSIVDAGLIPTGASTRNAGFACFGSLSEVAADARVMGQEAMLELVEMRFKGLEAISKHFGEEIDLDWCGGYELYDTAHHKKGEELEEEMRYINSLLKPVTGMKSTYRLADDEIENFGFGKTTHLVKNKLEGALHSGRLIRALLLAVQERGVQVFSNTDVHGIEKVGELLQLRTNRNFSLSTGKVLICTNAFTRSLVPDIDIQPARGQVLLTSPIEGLSLRGTFHSDEGYYYFRNLGNRVLLGGARNKDFEGETTIDMNTSTLIQQQLENYLSEVILPRYKGQYSIEHRWAGIMAMGSEKAPIIRELQPGVFCAVRMSGMGVALAPVVAKKVIRMMF